MPNLNVCTGPAFGVGSLGELEPANVRSAVWPFSSNPATAAAQMQSANGIRYDQTTIAPGGGLWVPEVGPVASTVRQSGSPGTNIAANGNFAAAVVNNVPFQNVSAVQTMTVMAILTFTVAVQTGGTAWVELWAGATLSAGSAAITYGPQMGDNASGNYVWHSSYSDSLVFTVAPSTTVNVVPQLQVKNASASGGPTATFISWTCNVAAFSALLDPIAEH